MSFRIRKAFLFPLGLLVAEIIALLISCIVFDQPIGKSIILGVMILPVVVLFVECLFRNTIIGNDNIRMRKLLRSKQINYADITSIETILVKKRAFITLCTLDDFLIFSNAYSKFPEMINLLLTKVPAEVITEETAAMAKNPPTKSTDILSCWMAVVLMGFILYAQLKMLL
ncbi:MAG: hypothetical protein RBR22_05800 [Desulfuromonas sp.]|nr:hypothetical protein [Desulfuromonas sp.]